MQRVTITLDDDLAADIDAFMAARGYPTRSEAIRDLSRGGLAQVLEESHDGQDCLAVLSFARDRGQGRSGQRLATLCEEAAGMIVSTLSTPAGGGRDLVVIVLKGPTRAVRQLSGAIVAEPAALHGRLVVLPAE